MAGASSDTNDKAQSIDALLRIAQARDAEVRLLKPKVRLGLQMATAIA